MLDVEYGKNSSC